MKFGIRECANMVFKAKSTVRIGKYTFQPGQPVLYLDTARTSTMEQAATTVYAQGGRGFSRLIAWEGEKTLTYTVEDALISPISLAMLSGACSPKQKEGQEVHVHTTSQAISNENEIDLTDALGADEKICPTAPIYVIETEDDGSLTATMIKGLTVDATGKKLTGTIEAGKAVFVDFYTIHALANTTELHITPDKMAGYYYVEADTLWRRQSDGVDLPANLTFPNVKIQSSFSIAMSSTGDPSAFTFTMDAFPGYTYFDKTHKVLAAIQIIDDANVALEECTTVFPHDDAEADFDPDDSVTPGE